MIEKIKYIILAAIGGLVSYLFGINTGKNKEKRKQEKEIINNVKKVNTISNTPDDIIAGMHDKYE